MEFFNESRKFYAIDLFHDIEIFKFKKESVSCHFAKVSKKLIQDNQIPVLECPGTAQILIWLKSYGAD